MRPRTGVFLVLCLAFHGLGAEEVLFQAPAEANVEQVEVAPGADFILESAGPRIGTSVNTTGKRFHQAEVMAGVRLPLDWDVGHDTHLLSRLDFSAGILGDGEKEAGIFRAVPVFTLRHEGAPVSFEIGLGPTVLTREKFSRKDFGLPLQFSSHLGINAEIGGRWRVGYAFEHMSNGGLETPNPGINMHVLVVSRLF